MKKLFTERHCATKPRIAEELDDVTRDALLNNIRARMDEEWFGLAFPDKCRDGYAYAGTDYDKLRAAMDGYGLWWPSQQIDPDSSPSDGQVFDVVEFAYEHLAEALNPQFHSYMSHSHYTYDKESGQEKFASDVNRIFERNGRAFELTHGEINRIAPVFLDDILAKTLFRTGDVQLDMLLETSRRKFLNRALDVRRESLEKLWDAWERLKTLEPGKDKKTSTKALLDKVTTEPTFRDYLETEAVQLTEIGNKFMIRHTEINKVPIIESAQVDYFFHRAFSMIRLLLKTTGRGAYAPNNKCVMVSSFTPLASAILTIHEDSSSSGRGFGCAGHSVPESISVYLVEFVLSLGWRCPANLIQNLPIDFLPSALNRMYRGSRKQLRQLADIALAQGHQTDCQGRFMEIRCFLKRQHPFETHQ